MSRRRSDLVSAFDDMLEDSRSRFNALDRTIAGRLGGNERTGVSSAEPSARSTASAPAPPDDARALSAGQKRVQARYGDRWRHEVLERRGEGDEVIVLCKLTVDDGATRSQFGRAAVGGVAGATKASTGGVAFSLGSKAASTKDAEDEAFRLAVDDALDKCLRLL